MSNAQILVVEDELLVAKDIQNILTKLGYSVPAIAASGEDAIKKVIENQPDLVLMDIVLKGDLDGVNTAEQIRLKFDIPIIYLTAYADDKTLERAKITEPFGYLIKPYQKKELHSNIEMALYKQKLEKMLKDSEQWLSTTLFSIGEGVVAANNNGLITFINPVAEELLGMKQEDLVDKPFNEILTMINESTGKQINSPLETVLGEGKVIQMSENVVLLGKDKLETPIEYVASPIKDEKGSINGIVMVFQDISLRKQAEKTIKESEERYRKLVDNFPEPMVVYCENKLYYMNPETIKLFKSTSSAELIGKSLVNFVHPDHRDDLKARLHEIEQGSEQQKYIKIKVLTLDGSEKDVDISASHIYYYGKPAVQIVLKDITVGRKAEEVLRESEEKYRSVVERANDGIAIIQDGLLKYINPIIEKMIGYEKDELIDAPIVNFLHPDEKTRVIDYYNRRMAGEKVPTIYETIILDKDGSKREIEINAAIIHYNGKIADLVIIRDISERKGVENALKESEERYRRLVNTSPDAIIYSDLKGKIQMVNSKALNLYGVETETELIGKNVFEFISPEDRSRAMENSQNVMKGKPISNIQYLLIRKDGKTYHGEISASLITDSEGNPKGLIGVVRDITERLLITEALQKSEEKYRLLVDNINDGVYTLDENGYFTFVNNVIENRSGMSKEKFKKLQFNDIVSPADRERVLHNFEKVINGEEVPPYQLEYATSDGSPLAVEVNTKPIYQAGKIIGLQGISRDITERKKAEKELLMANERLKYLLSSSNAVIYTARASGDYGATFISKNVAKMVGYESREFTENSGFWIDRIHPDDVQHVLTDVAKIFEKGQYKYEYRFRRKDGKYIWVRDEMKLVRDEKGEPLEIIGNWVDISDKYKK
jgi:PAS domain S-box-containing protein